VKKRRRRWLYVRDIPDDVIAEIRRYIVDFTVGLLAIEAGGRQLRAGFCGSATLVSAHGRRFILTASHVWDALSTDGAAEVGIGIREGPDRLRVPCRYLRAFSVGRRRTASWGPDVVFLELPPNKVGSIAAVKSCYNLDRHRGQELSGKLETENLVWAIAGSFAVRSKLGPRYAEIQGGAYFSGIPRAHANEGWDYLDLGVRFDEITSFEGMSGGGLWYAPVVRLKNGEIGLHPSVRPTFKGVAFYQKRIRGVNGFVRCHGPVSVFRHGRGVVVKSRDAAPADGPRRHAR